MTSSLIFPYIAHIKTASKSMFAITCVRLFEEHNFTKSINSNHSSVPTLLWDRLYFSSVRVALCSSVCDKRNCQIGKSELVSLSNLQSSPDLKVYRFIQVSFSKIGNICLIYFPKEVGTWDTNGRHLFYTTCQENRAKMFAEVCGV